ncbi:MAG: signal peptidase I [Gordonia sp. (in: high G+C Gram-positive bacteria)]|nr:MAG: signal peptidase I [Gordonia sp. (in: high G+C Gram-positive bacteria)]
MSTRARKIITEAALTVGAIAGVLCVVAAVVSASFGLSPLVFRSNSMAPAIDVGDVAISRSVPAIDIRPGDIVSVSRADGTRITHRVVSIDARVGNSATMTLRGDANNVNDPEPYTVTDADRVAFRVPGLGYVLTLFANPYSWAIAALLTLSLLFVAFRPDKQLREPNSGRHSAVPSTPKRGMSIVMQVVVVAVVAATSVTGYARTHSTLAALTDSATATGSVSTSRPLVPASLSCSNAFPGVQLSWPNPVSAHGYSYELVFVAAVVGTSRTVVLPASTANPTVLTVSNTSPLSPLIGIYNVELRSKVGNFLSTGKLTIRIQEGLGIVTCGQFSGTPSQTAAAARLAPVPATTTSSTAPTTSTSNVPPTTSASPEPTTTTTTPPTTSTDAPAPSSIPPATTTSAPTLDSDSPGGTFSATSNNGSVTIRDKASGAEEFRTEMQATKFDWADDATLRVTALDGTVTTVTRTDGQWVSGGGSAVATASPAG